MKAKKTLFSMLLLVGCFHFLTAQISVKGTVTDESKAPLLGVGISIKNTTRGVSTDFDGKYEIKAQEGDILVFTSLGFVTQEKKVMRGG
ncbi:carboxypeptidase-like regulatory domain-containing protein [Capnocytophaga sp.]|uniref:carboxypeptidase-like regulatory domain-containing protein n=1 Tax=Capnocytophaga sp. TaxID=44737 RepID=UPI0026DDC9F9|nr:carboxypeptidase-like regulatory domain-containing protein [Capnocytophaga sp.]MDO5104862.1 carboxypeptidase-like regulatory domain-containing protein [Capnocytophaga sp.]